MSHLKIPSKRLSRLSYQGSLIWPKFIFFYLFSHWPKCFLQYMQSNWIGYMKEEACSSHCRRKASEDTKRVILTQCTVHNGLYSVSITHTVHNAQYPAIPLLENPWQAVDWSLPKWLLRQILDAYDEACSLFMYYLCKGRYKRKVIELQPHLKK